MKALAILLLGSLTAGLFVTTSDDHDLARVERRHGFYLFAECEPVSDYEVEYTNDPGAVWSKEYDNVIEMHLKKCKKKCPNCDGVIIRGGYEADFIRFTD